MHDSNDTLGSEDPLEHVAEYERGLRESVFRKFVERPAVETLLPPLEGSRVLSVGTGPGYGAARLAERGATVVGVDRDEDMCRYAAREYGDTVTVGRANPERLPFDDDTFDVVVCRLALELLPDLSLPVTEFSRVLSDNGVAVVSTEHPFTQYLSTAHGKKPMHGVVPKTRDVDYFETTGKLAYREDIDELVEEDGYRRPLAATTGAFLDAGLCLTAVEELGPTPAIAERHEGFARQLREEPPLYLCLRAEPR